MTASSWLSLLAICVLGVISPGPSLAAVMKSTVQGSRAHGLVTSISHALGIGIYAFLVAAGIGVVITETPWLYKFITYAGAAYLAWMGYKAITSSSSLVKESHQLQQQLSLKQAAIDGFLVSFLNPKIAVFLLALFSQFVTPEIHGDDSGIDGSPCYPLRWHLVLFDRFSCRPMAKCCLH